MFSIDFEVSAAEIEARYNHVHHATCVRFLERARLAYLDSIGCPNEELISQGLFLVISAIEVKYKRELFLGPIRVTCEDPRIEGKEIVLLQHVYNAKGKEAVEARVVSMCMSGESKRAIVPPESFTQKFLGAGGKIA